VKCYCSLTNKLVNDFPEEFLVVVFLLLCCIFASQMAHQVLWMSEYLTTGPTLGLFMNKPIISVEDLHVLLVCSAKHCEVMLFNGCVSTNPTGTILKYLATFTCMAKSRVTLPL